MFLYGRSDDVDLGLLVDHSCRVWGEICAIVLFGCLRHGTMNASFKRAQFSILDWCGKIG